MKFPFIIRYLAQKTFWVIVRPIRACYRFFVRPTYKAAKVVVVRDNKILLVRPDYGHRQWTLPGGNLEKGETYEEAAIREVREETGLEVRDLTFVREYEADHTYFKSLIQSFATEVSDEHFTIDGIEIKEAAWFPLNQLPKGMVPRSRKTTETFIAMRQGR